MGVMSFVAGWFPLLSVAIGALSKWWLYRSWVGAVLVLTGSFAVFRFVFGLHFWPWILLYVFLSWFGSWAVWFARQTAAEKRNPSVR